MDAQIEQAKTVLAVYLKRGQAALSKLASDEVDDALSLCLWRAAAFHNFRAIDSSLKSSGIDLAAEGEMMSLIEEINAVNISLEEGLIEAAEDAKSRLKRMRHLRNTIPKFHSGVVTQGDLRKV